MAWSLVEDLSLQGIHHAIRTTGVNNSMIHNLPWVDPDASDDEADVEQTDVPSTSGLASAPPDFLEIQRTFVLKQIERKQHELALLRTRWRLLIGLLLPNKGENRHIKGHVYFFYELFSYLEYLF